MSAFDWRFAVWCLTTLAGIAAMFFRLSYKAGQVISELASLRGRVERIEDFIDRYGERRAIK